MWAIHLSAFAQINVSTGIDNIGNPLPVGIGNDWYLSNSPYGAITPVVCPSYSPYWQATPIIGTNAQWLNQSSFYYNSLPGSYVFERTFTVAPSTGTLNLNFGIAFDDILVSAFLIPPSGPTVALTFPSSSTPYTISPYPSPSVISNPVPGIWTIQITINYYDSVGGFIASGTIDSDSIIQTCNCDSLPFFAGKDIVLYDTQSVILAPTSGFDDYNWSPITALDSPNIENPTATPTTTTTYVVTATKLGTELIVNGNFSLGNIGFTSDYNFSYYAPCNYTTQPDQWASFVTDHTPTLDNMGLTIDGCSMPNMRIWSQELVICPNTDYQFSLWMSGNDVSPQQIEVKFNGVYQTLFMAQPLNPNATQTEYYKYTYNWNSGNNTNLTIDLTDLELESYGNDFVVDDISFRQACFYTDSVTIYVYSLGLENSNNLNLKTFPNPVQDELWIEYEVNFLHKTIDLCDIYGRTWISRELNPSGKTLLETKELANGIYILRIDGKVFQKIVK